MGRALLSFVTALCACGCAMGEPPKPEEVEALGTALAEEDSGKRQIAQERLESLADAHPEELRSLLRHPDKEVSSRVRETLGKRGVFEDPVLTRQCAAYLAAFSDTQDFATRRELLRTLFALGREVREYVAWEFSDSVAEVLPPKSIVVETPLAPCLQVRYRNPTRHGLWFDPRIYATRLEGEPLVYGWKFPCVLGMRFCGSGLVRGEPALALLARFRRIRPGAEFDGAGRALFAQHPGKWSGELDPLYRDVGYSYEWEETIVFDPPALPHAKCDTVFWIREERDEDFVSLTRPEAHDPTLLEVETKEGNIWNWGSGRWFAISGEDAVIAEGDVVTQASPSDPESTRGRFKLAGDPPPDTVRLWVALAPPCGIPRVSRLFLVVTQLTWPDPAK